MTLDAMIVVRPAGEADAAGIARVHVDTWRSTYAGLLPASYLVGLSKARQAANWARLLAHDSERRGTIVAAERELGVVGFISVGPVRKVPTVAAEDWRGAGEVYTLYVSPDHQNDGIGRRLLAAGFAELQARAITRAVIWVLAPNPSRFFYHAMGGRPIGVQQENFAGQTVDEIAYGWRDVAATAAHLAERARGQGL
jgi:ribosomal protein S18 acetylase RimI-like enzyme